MKWFKYIVISIIILTLVGSYSLFFIDFSSYQNQQSFEGPEENPTINIEHLPEGMPTSEGPTEAPPAGGAN